MAVNNELTPTLVRDIIALLHEWRGGRLGNRRPTGIVHQPVAPPVSRFGPLYQVTAVGGGTCNVQRVDAAGDPVEDTDLTGLLYDVEPVVGDNVLLCRRIDGSLAIFPGFPWWNIAGYDPAKTQGLSHVSGVLTWQDTGEC